MPRKNPPLLNVGPISGKVFIVTRYRVIDAEKGHYEAQEKYDVTGQFEAIAEQRDHHYREALERIAAVSPTSAFASIERLVDIAKEAINGG